MYIRTHTSTSSSSSVAVESLSLPFGPVGFGRRHAPRLKKEKKGGGLLSAEDGTPAVEVRHRCLRTRLSPHARTRVRACAGGLVHARVPTVFCELIIMRIIITLLFYVVIILQYRISVRARCLRARLQKKKCHTRARALIGIAAAAAMSNPRHYRVIVVVVAV